MVLTLEAYWATRASLLEADSSSHINQTLKEGQHMAGICMDSPSFVRLYLSPSGLTHKKAENDESMSTCSQLNFQHLVTFLYIYNREMNHQDNPCTLHYRTV